LVENGQNKFPYTIKAIDHSEAFRDYSPVFDIVEHFGEHAINDPTIFGYFPEFSSHLDRVVANQVSDQLAGVNVSEIQTIFNRIPKSWKLETKTGEAFISFIVKRAVFIANTLTKMLFPKQSSLLPYKKSCPKKKSEFIA
jgi:hypothetical protein